jgi:hypothetical protein
MNRLNLQQMLDANELLSSLLRNVVDSRPDTFDELLDRLALTKKALFDNFGEIAARRYLGRPELGTAKQKVTQHLFKLCEGRIPIAEIKIPNFLRVHEMLLAYFADNVGRNVRAIELRALTGDQTHTERRVRQFRDLGLRIEWKNEAGDLKYFLPTLEQDLDFASAFWLRKRIKNGSFRNEILRLALDKLGRTAT